jgi:hypothetical protein
MPDRLYNLFGERLTLRQTDHDRYMDIVGRGAVELDEIPGRGYVRYDRRPLPFQAALPTGIFDHEGRLLCPEADDLAGITAAMRARLGPDAPRPTLIEILHNQISLDALLAAAPAPEPTQTLAVLGYSASLELVTVNLAEVGPHMLIVGPPQSGKTTALRTLALSLAMRYEPARARIVLIDVMQGRLFNYGGDHRLSDLPHVLEAVDDPAQLPGLIDRLREACEGLAKLRSPLFVLIDGLEDLAAEIDNRLATELAALLRKYGSDGLHVIATSAADATNTDLRRRVLASGFGLGLRSAQAVELLRVTRTPAALRDRELPRGRGYLVRSGQAQMVQVATPISAQQSEARHLYTAALDSWVTRVRDQFRSAPRAVWSRPSANTPPALKTEERQIHQMADLVRALVRREMTMMQQGKAANHSLVDLLFDATIWSDRERLRKPLADEVRRFYASRGIAEIAETVIHNDEHIIKDLTSKLQPYSDGTNGKERP